ncbi:hypothetical protein KY290_003568 [Solanum tuberosum]|uniref:Endonuclease/exonuclease/phosphatase domain-containing protein n=1 Tax=Solanum tuberosum TaxID=4113 RepID=A0ABQ7WTB4_SOLTU|nr:hypothetical protein KY284_024806 [Solanum tuberosum]KAH0727850.1 hypothetical protein KY284_003715 [Solanum tuberosum]KAH0767698.1 hypothetical protein KY285_003569 [Solanum tuberosum]KAH0783970.1 hypothetical protein KY290_003568 [Solanum tuberosum]
MQTPNLEDEETMGYEADEDMEDHVVPQMQEEGLSSPIQHQATQESREEVLNILDPFTQTLHLKEPLTLEMQKDIERKYIIIIPHQVKKASINICYHNLSNKMTYVILAIPSSQKNLGATMENMEDNHPTVNLDMTLIPGGSSSTQEDPLMKILLWNCRGAHNAIFMTNLHSLVELNKPTILALTETRMKDHNKILQALDFTDVIQVPVIGYSGGIALLWRNTEITIETFVLTDQEIHATIEVRPSITK